MKAFFEKYKMVIGAIALTLGVMATWQNMDFLPRWAWHDEVEKLQAEMSESQSALQRTMQEQIASNAQFAVQTRLLVLGQEWERLDREITRLEEKGNLTAEERELLSKKRLRKTLVSEQIKDLQKEL